MWVIIELGTSGFCRDAHLCLSACAFVLHHFISLNTLLAEMKAGPPFVENYKILIVGLCCGIKMVPQPNVVQILDTRCPIALRRTRTCLLRLSERSRARVPQIFQWPRSREGRMARGLHGTWEREGRVPGRSEVCMVVTSHLCQCRAPGPGVGQKG